VSGASGGLGAEVFVQPEFSTEDVRGLENISTTAWPASERVSLDGWIMRYSPTPTRRVNSVLANAYDGNRELGDRIADVEAFYADKGQSPRFQLTRGSLPEDLDGTLAQRGYEVETPVDIQVSPVKPIHAAVRKKGRTRILDDMAPGWLAVYADGFDRDVTAVIEQISGRAAFMTFEHKAQVLGVALGVLSAGWLGIFGMHTVKAHRSQGIGVAMLGGLAEWAAESDARGMYLQVEQSNPRAQALYERLGFRTVYTYHYRTLF